MSSKKPRGEENYQRVKSIVHSYVETFEELPSISDLALNTGISKALAGFYLQRMEREGLVYSKGSRGYVGAGRERLDALVRMPVVGTVSCGYRKLAVEEIEDYIALPKGSLGPGDYFCLVADGNSMINAGINSGDYVIIRQQSVAEKGQIVVALVGEEATLKRYEPHPEEGYVDLVAENPAVATQRIQLNEYEPMLIQGVAVKVLHNLE